MEKNEDYLSLADIVQKTKELTRFLIRKWWLLAIAAVVGAIAGFSIFHLQKPKYEAACTFILEEKQSGMGGLSSIASQFGFDMGSLGGGGSIFAGDNILDILKSKSVVQKVLLTRVNDSSGGTTLADSYVAFSNLKKKWKNEPLLANINFQRQASLSPVQDSALNIIYDRLLKKELIAERINKKGSIIKVQVTTPDMKFSRLLSMRLVDEAGKMYLSIKIGTALANIAKMQRRSDSLLSLLNHKSYSVAATQLLDVNPGFKAASVPVEIATRDKTVIATLYTEVTKNLEASKLLLSQQTPVIQLLDVPGLTLFDNKKSLPVLIALSVVITVLLAAGFLSVQFFLQPHT